MIPMEAQAATLKKWLDALDVPRTAADGERPLCLLERVTLRCADITKTTDKALLNKLNANHELVAKNKHLEQTIAVFRQVISVLEHDDFDPYEPASVFRGLEEIRQLLSSETDEA